MRKGSSLRRIVYSSATFLVPIIFLIAAAHSANAQCPPPSIINAAGECILTRNVELTATLFMPSNTTLNCQGHTIVPDSQGQGNLNPSTPAVAVFIDGAQNVQIKNCIIDRFDFGVFAVKIKIAPFSPSIQIFQNTIKARFAGISLMSVDDAEVRDNVVTLTTNGGKAIYVGRNSDRNRIISNEIGVSIPVQFNDTRVLRVPGPELSSNPAVPTAPPLANGSAVGAGSAILITQSEGNEPSLLNAIFEGNSAQALCKKKKCLIQLPINFSAQPNGDFSEGNLVEGNRIRINTGFLSIDGVVLAVPQGTRVSKNTINGAKSSIRVGIQSGPIPVGVKKQFPGQCSNSGRDCLGRDDCNIADIDLTTDAICTLPQPKSVFWVSHNTIIEDNLVLAPFEFGISTTGVGTVITGNTIKRPDSSLANPTGTGLVLIGPFALERPQPLEPDTPTVITRNIVKDLNVGIHLVQEVPNQPLLSAKNFGAKIGLNDFTGYNIPVVISKKAPPVRDKLYFAETTDITSELSAVLEDSLIPRGNFWGNTCPQGAFNTNAVQNSDPSVQRLIPQPLVIDSHPFGVRVAFIPGIAPVPCPSR